MRGLTLHPRPICGNPPREVQGPAIASARSRPWRDGGTAGASHPNVVEAIEEAEKEQMRRVGQTLREKWHLDALLGVGGMATVYAATHRNGARCAVKVLHAGEDEEIKQRFQREGYIANRVEHP